MIASPLHPLGFISDTLALLSALPLGLAFGFLLERAGFANPRNVVGQFLLTDLRVLKMMFTALVTAMLGVLALAHFSLIDLSLLLIPPTHLPDQLIGGALLGLGLITAGYCPGTSVVGAATGRIDAWLCLVGISLGVMLFAAIDPSIAGLLGRASATRSSLPQVLGIPSGWIALAVTIMAAAAFLAAEWVEIHFGGKPPNGQTLLSGQDDHLSRILIGGLLALALFLACTKTPPRPTPPIPSQPIPAARPQAPALPQPPTPTPRPLPSGC